MNTKFMRMMVFFDLPQTTDSNVRDYRKFHKMLINNGFIMMQYSIYTKVVMTSRNVDHYKKKLYKNVPPKGNVRILVITERQYNSMDLILGEKTYTEKFNDDSRMKVIE